MGANNNFILSIIIGTLLKTVLYDVALLIASIKDTFNVLSNLNIWGLTNGGSKNALGLGYSSGDPNNYQTVIIKQDGTWGEYQLWKGFNASSEHNFKGGYTWVGENGAELVSLPSGSNILNAQESRNASGTVINGDIINDAKNVKEFNDIVTMAKNSRVHARKVYSWQRNLQKVSMILLHGISADNLS